LREPFSGVVQSALGVTEEQVLGAGDSGTFTRDQERFVQAVLLFAFGTAQAG